MLNDLVLKTPDNRIILAGYSQTGHLRLGDMWLKPKTVFNLYNSFSKGEREIPFSTEEGHFMEGPRDLTALLNPKNLVLRIGDYKLPITEFEKFAVYVFKKELQEGPIQPHGDKVIMMHSYMQEYLESILLNGLAPQQ